jgi:hypothetical protein
MSSRKNVIVCLPSDRNAIIKNITYLAVYLPRKFSLPPKVAAWHHRSGLHHPYPNSASQKSCRTQLLLFPWSKKFGFARFLHNIYARHVTLCSRLHIHMADPECSAIGGQDSTSIMNLAPIFDGLCVKGVEGGWMVSRMSRWSVSQWFGRGMWTERRESQKHISRCQDENGSIWSDSSQVNINYVEACMASPGWGI